MKYNTGINTSNGDWIRLNLNENLFLEQEVLQDIVIGAVRKTSLNYYPDTESMLLKERLAELHHVEVNNIFIGNGADEVLSSLFFLFRKKFDTVNIPRICFKMYNTLSSKYDFIVRSFDNYPLVEEAISTSNKGLFFIDSPNSITGYTLKPELLDRLYSDKDNFIVHDNVQGDFANELPTGVRSNLIVIRHFSKFYGLASLRIGYCIATKDIIEQMNVYREPFNVNSIAQLAALECLERHDYFLSRAELLMQQKIIFEKKLYELNFEILESSSNFILIKHKYVNSELLHKKLAENKIATRHFSTDEYLKFWLRVTIPLASDQLKIIDELSKIIDSFSTF